MNQQILQEILQEISQPHVAIHCPTQAKADMLSTLLGGNIVAAAWSVCKEDTCFYYKEGKYSDLQFAKDLKYKILTAEYIISSLHPIKVGDIYKNSAGKVCTISDYFYVKEIQDYIISYCHEDGKVYKASLPQLIKNWTKQTSPPKEQPMIANLQLGTKVRVRPDLIVDTTNYYMSNSSIRGSVTDEMMIMAGNIATITGRTSTGTKYLIKESEGFWTDEMFSEIISLPDEEQTKPEPNTKRNLAFYKRSGDPWTKEEAINIYEYCKDDVVVTPLRTYIFDNGGIGKFMYDWSSQKTHPNFSNCKQVAYEDIFESSKPEPVRNSVKLKCSPEPTIKPIQKDNFMTKLKDTALTTVEQNKGALIIAAKMEAGRIINKQVLKQLSPHLPFFVQGYTKSPLAPLVVANLVAMVANHTQNNKLRKVSELMVLGAADSSVAAFNIDKIVDDILSGVKLPKGVLDIDEE